MSGEVQNSLTTKSLTNSSSSGDDASTTIAGGGGGLKFSVERLLSKSPCRKKRKLHRLDNGNYFNQLVREPIPEEELEPGKPSCCFSVLYSLAI